MPGRSPHCRGRRQQQEPERGDNAWHNPDDLGNPRRQEHAPGALPRSPTHTVYSAHQEPTTQWRTVHYPCTANTTGPQAGETTGDGTTGQQLEPDPDQTPSQRTDYSAHAIDRTASNLTRTQGHREDGAHARASRDPPTKTGPQNTGACKSSWPMPAT